MFEHPRLQRSPDTPGHGFLDFARGPTSLSDLGLVLLPFPHERSDGSLAPHGKLRCGHHLEDRLRNRHLDVAFSVVLVVQTQACHSDDGCLSTNGGRALWERPLDYAVPLLMRFKVCWLLTVVVCPGGCARRGVWRLNPNTCSVSRSVSW
ncbi:hypothetical protein PC111_g21443 [Phytophthora cactorum]|nr:hypothetical protein PC111_g21443 [Phytophthora cactorum]